MAILKIRDADGNVQEIIALKGDKGDPGEFAGGELLAAHINNKNNPHSVSAEELGVGDYVIADGTTNGWTWRKWNNGLAEMWGKFSPSEAEMNMLPVPLVPQKGEPLVAIAFSASTAEPLFFPQPKYSFWQDDSNGSLIRIDVIAFFQTIKITSGEIQVINDVSADVFERITGYWK